MTRQKFIVYQNAENYQILAVPANDPSLKTAPLMATEGYKMTLSRTTPKRALNAALSRGFAENLDSKLGVSNERASNYATIYPSAQKTLEQVVNYRRALEKFLS
jgi:hypothetical protein